MTCLGPHHHATQPGTTSGTRTSSRWLSLSRLPSLPTGPLPGLHSAELPPGFFPPPDSWHRQGPHTHFRMPSSQSDQTFPRTHSVSQLQWLCCCTTYGNLPPDLALCSGHQSWPHRDCPHPRSQVCWHSYLAPAPKRFQFFSEDLGHRSGSPRGSELQTCLAKGNHANQKNSTLKPLLNLPVELGHRCDPVLESGCASVYWRVVWEQG